MWVDMDDLRAELERLARETEEEFAGRSLPEARIGTYQKFEGGITCVWNMQIG